MILCESQSGIICCKSVENDKNGKIRTYTKQHPQLRSIVPRQGPILLASVKAGEALTEIRCVIQYDKSVLHN